MSVVNRLLILTVIYLISETTAEYGDGYYEHPSNNREDIWWPFILVILILVVSPIVVCFISCVICRRCKRQPGIIFNRDAGFPVNDQIRGIVLLQPSAPIGETV